MIFYSTVESHHIFRFIKVSFKRHIGLRLNWMYLYVQFNQSTDCFTHWITLALKVTFQPVWHCAPPFTCHVAPMALHSSHQPHRKDWLTSWRVIYLLMPPIKLILPDYESDIVHGAATLLPCTVTTMLPHARSCPHTRQTWSVPKQVVHQT